jgi:hypothetical protein
MKKALVYKTSRKRRYGKGMLRPSHKVKVEMLPLMAAEVPLVRAVPGQVREGPLDIRHDRLFLRP